MEIEESGEKVLLNALMSEVKAQSEKIISDAQIQAENRKDVAKKEADSILKEARGKAKDQAQRILQKQEMQTQMICRRMILLRNDSVIKSMQDSLLQKAQEKIISPHYNDLLQSWIVEATIGLGEAKMSVNASAEEKKLIDAPLLQRAIDEIKNTMNYDCHLVLSDEKPLSSQGVVVSSLDKPLSYSNRVSDRILRMQSTIRSVIYKQLLWEQS